MSVAELAALEGISTKTVYDGVRLYGWPCYRRGPNGGVIKFDVAQLLEIREMHRVPANPGRRAPRRKPRKKPAPKAA